MCCVCSFFTGINFLLQKKVKTVEKSESEDDIDVLANIEADDDDDYNVPKKAKGKKSVRPTFQMLDMLSDDSDDDDDDKDEEVSSCGEFSYSHFLEISQEKFSIFDTSLVNQNCFYI